MSLNLIVFAQPPSSRTRVCSVDRYFMLIWLLETSGDITTLEVEWWNVLTSKLPRNTKDQDLSFYESEHYSELKDNKILPFSYHLDFCCWLLWYLLSVFNFILFSSLSLSVFLSPNTCHVLVSSITNVVACNVTPSDIAKGTSRFSSTWMLYVHTCNRRY